MFGTLTTTRPSARSSGRQPVQRAVGVGQVLEHVGEDELVELAGRERQRASRALALDDDVEPLAGAVGGLRVELDPRDVGGARCLQRGAERALAATHVEDRAPAASTQPPGCPGRGSP